MSISGISSGSCSAAIAWPHAPTHRLTETGIYFVTAGTYRKQPHFRKGQLLRMLHNALLAIADKHSWRLEAWAVFPNHYHFVAAAPENAASLIHFTRELHSRTAIALNRHEGTPGRRIWFNYWETRLKTQAAYLTRLSYVHQNAVKHGVTSIASHYPWCSARWFEGIATPAQVRTIYSLKTDTVQVYDDF